MKKSLILILLKAIVALSFCELNIAKADVYIDLSQTAEISITQDSEHYTLKIEEPYSAPSPKRVALSSHSAEHINALPFNAEVIIASNESAIEPALIHAVISAESNHNPYAQSKKGAYGLMQLMPETSRRFNVKNKNDPKQNVVAGAKYLRELLNIFNGDLNLTLAAYNAGPAAVKKYGGKIPPYKETLDYVPKVLKYYHQYY
ncbi:transglycosylase SLT domain-containing protein [Methylotenera versatilis]|uniref:Lytic transglycosylase catalytic n=1 Tax=Methylotenera versatilis (strain 301) TaxID=666681 RepID=D7DNV2_METV0|nr:transglycosylase SLT domain-containing protein [Methylotenera versatilis]ADI29119.1 Lytic transglycosylase catalytic [Methylotenera versatilis 301]